MEVKKLRVPFYDKQLCAVVVQSVMSNSLERLSCKISGFG
jgi:hypothetical protein